MTSYYTVKHASRTASVVVLLILAIFTSCKSEKSNSESSDEKNPKILGSDKSPNNPKTLGADQEENSSMALEKAEITEEETESLLSNYLDLKNALVNSNSEKASESAGEIVEILLLKKDEFSGSLSAEAEKIMQSKVIEEQRQYFTNVTKSIYTLAQKADLNQELYYQYCPMAFNNTGAYWLSAEKEISNPYFGEKMLRCGSTKEVID